MTAPRATTGLGRAPGSGSISGPLSTSGPNSTSGPLSTDDPLRRLETMAQSRRELAARLSFFDASVWLGEAEGFPLARELPIPELLGVCREYGLSGLLLSHWAGRAVSPQDGNRLLIEAFAGGAAAQARKLGIELGAVWTGVPVMAGEEGPLPGPAGPGTGSPPDAAASPGATAAGGPDPAAAGNPPAELAGVRLFPRSHNFPLSPWVLQSLVEWLLAYRLPLFVWHEETDWDDLHALSGAFPELPVVLETQARKILYQSRPLYALLGTRPNLYVETSNLVGPDFLGYAVRHYGAERLIFGSFLPQNDPLAAMGMLLDADISEADMRLVAGGNLRRLLDRRLPGERAPEEGSPHTPARP